MYRGIPPIGKLANAEGIKKSSVKDSLVGLRMVAGKRLDVMIASKIGLLSVVNKNNMADQLGEYFIVDEIIFGAYSQKKLADDPKTIQLTKALETARTDGTFDELGRKFFGAVWDQ